MRREVSLEDSKLAKRLEEGADWWPQGGQRGVEGWAVRPRGEEDEKTRAGWGWGVLALLWIFLLVEDTVLK